MSRQSLFVAVLLFFVFTEGNAQTNQSQKKTTSQKNGKNASFFNGGWISNDNKGFSVMHDGYFNAVAQDSTGKWDDVHAGSYTVNNDNTITFKVLYSSYPDHVGSINTAEYTISGDKVRMRHFKNLIDPQGKDITDHMPKDVVETMTRAK